MDSNLITVNLQVVHSPESDDLGNLPWEKWFNVWGISLKSQLPEQSSCELTLRLTDDQEISALNSRFRDIDGPTDVLAFAALEADLPYLPEEAVELGDIVISVETARRQAAQLNHSLTIELAWLASHGFLHLLGWDHPDSASLEVMLRQQASLLQSVELLTDQQGVNLATSDYT